MSAKNLDKKNRWRSVTVAFRVSPEEAYRLNMVAKTSGLTNRYRYNPMDFQSNC